MKGWFNPNLSAEQLMVKFVDSNNSKYLSQLVQLFNDDLYHYLRSQISQQYAEDILQSLWLKVIEKRHYFNWQMSFKSWVFTIARNCLIDELRRDHRWQYSELDEIVDENVQSVEQVHINSDLQQAFNCLLEQLPFVQKESFILQQEGFSITEIANICSTKPETIKSRLRYARNYFKQHLEALNDK